MCIVDVKRTVTNILYYGIQVLANPNSEPLLQILLPLCTLTMKLWSHEILSSMQLCILSILCVNKCFQTHQYCKCLLAPLQKCDTTFAFVFRFFSSVAVFIFPCHVCFMPDILFIKIHGSQITACAVWVGGNTHLSLNISKLKFKQF